MQVCNLYSKVPILSPHATSSDPSFMSYLLKHFWSEVKIPSLANWQPISYSLGNGQNRIRCRKLIAFQLPPLLAVSAQLSVAYYETIAHQLAIHNNTWHFSRQANPKALWWRIMHALILRVVSILHCSYALINLLRLMVGMPLFYVRTSGSTSFEYFNYPFISVRSNLLLLQMNCHVVQSNSRAFGLFETELAERPADRLMTWQPQKAQLYRARTSPRTILLYGVDLITNFFLEL